MEALKLRLLVKTNALPVPGLGKSGLCCDGMNKATSQAGAT